MSLVGCKLEGNLNELAKELGNPDKDNFESPGTRLAKGAYAYPAIEGNSSSGAFITALRDGNHLAIVDYDTHKGCAVGPVRAYRSPARKDTENSGASAADILMPVILAATDDKPVTLVFSDLKCRLSTTTLETAALPLSDTFPADGGFLTQDSAGGVWHLDPRKDVKKRVAEGALPVASDSLVLFIDGPEGDRWMLTLEAGEIVGRDSKFKEVFRAGQDIAGFIHHKDASGSAVLVSRTTSGAYVSIPLEAPDAVTSIAERVCTLKIYDGKSARQMMWIDCENKDLMLYDFATEKTTTVASKTKNYRIIDQTDKGPLVLYLEVDGDDSTEWGPLYARWGTDAPVFLGENGNLRMTWLDTKGTQRPLVDWDAEARTGTLKYAAPGDDLKNVAKGVVYVSSLGVISNYDGSNGTFSRLDKTKLTLVHERVHPKGLRLDPDKTRERLLMSANVDEDGAELTLVSGETTVQKLIDHAIVDSYGFSLNTNLVSVLTDADEDDGRIGTLQMVHIDRPVSQVISTGVLHALETTWPEPGLLYAAPAAEDPGLYFAKATR
jgi:hypothetical protein